MFTLVTIGINKEKRNITGYIIKTRYAISQCLTPAHRGLDVRWPEHYIIHMQLSMFIHFHNVLII